MHMFWDQFWKNGLFEYFAEFVGGHFLTIFIENVSFKQFFLKIDAYAYVWDRFWKIGFFECFAEFVGGQF